MSRSSHTPSNTPARSTARFATPRTRRLRSAIAAHSRWTPREAGKLWCSGALARPAHGEPARRYTKRRFDLAALYLCRPASLDKIPRHIHAAWVSLLSARLVPALARRHFKEGLAYESESPDRAD